MIFFDQKMTCIWCVCVLMWSTQVAAMQQSTTSSEMNARIEKRRQFVRELQELKNARRAENSASKAVEYAGPEMTSPANRREALRSANDLKRSERPVEKNLRLSPEERVALRRQIREARIEIYQRRKAKNN